MKRVSRYQDEVEGVMVDFSKDWELEDYQSAIERLSAALEAVTDAIDDGEGVDGVLSMLTVVQTALGEA